MNKFEQEKLQNMSNAIRGLSIDAVEKANSGHPGMPLGMADVATVLFSKYLKFDPHKPDWLNRDRFVLSAGHGSMLLYALSYLVGYKDCSLNQIKNNHPNIDFVFRSHSSATPIPQCIRGINVEETDRSPSDYADDFIAFAKASFNTK